MADVTVTVSGPVFRPAEFAQVMDAACDQAERDVSAQAFAEVLTNMNASIKRPTPYLETQVRVEEQAPWTVVHNSGVIYEAWIEGTGSRNKTTRFKGYANFRRAAQTVEAKAHTLVEHAIAPFVRRLG